MAKRTAQKQLTMDNFEQEDDEDYSSADAGPQLATDDVLKSRPMAKARRRSDLNSQTAEETKRSAFTGFGGFKGFATNTSQNPSFNAFKSMTQMETNDNTLKTSLPSTQTNGGKTAVNPRTESAVEDMTTEDADDLYNNKLSELNKCFYQHIQSYMSRSEFFDFTPVCKEYIDYHQKIQSETKAEPIRRSSVGQVISTSSFMPSASSFPYTQSTSSASFMSAHTFGTQSTTSSQSSSPITSQSGAMRFSSQSSPNEDQKQSVFAKPTIQFGLTSKPLSTGLSATESTSAPTAADNNGAEESDEPPKVESVEHKEPDSVFSKKCKLYFKKGEEWCEKGVGFVYIKKEASGDSPAQLLIRANNTLGVILLHISLNDSLPISKAPQNRGVLLSCIPNPPLDPKATTQTSVSFLIRVKETEQLFDALIKYKSNQ